MAAPVSHNTVNTAAMLKVAKRPSKTGMPNADSNPKTKKQQETQKGGKPQLIHRQKAHKEKHKPKTR